jgi:dTDP-glucose 4,6-dehydratase
MDASNITSQIGWKPAESFESGLRKTVAWYLDNPDWVAHVTSGAYRHWIEKNYAGRGKA